MASKQKEELMLARRRVDEMSSELTKLRAQVTFLSKLNFLLLLNVFINYMAGAGIGFSQWGGQGNNTTFYAFDNPSPEQLAGRMVILLKIEGS